MLFLTPDNDFAGQEQVISATRYFRLSDIIQELHEQSMITYIHTLNHITLQHIRLC